MTPVERFALRARFGLAQAARVGWYASQNAAGVRVGREAGRDLPPPPKPVIEAPAGIPDRATLLRHVRKLLVRDLANVEAGLYPMPTDEPDGLRGLLARRDMYLRDIPSIVRRRATGSHQEVDRSEGKRPRYYMQNFHFQTDGWMTEDSARLYDTQVETLFFGAAAAMRRQGLVPIADMVRTRDQRSLRMLDVASGSGAFLRDVRLAFPRLPVIASDLSEPYVRLARGKLAPRPGAGAVVGAAEGLPFRSDAFDIVSTIYLFHELPPKVRPLVAAEMARVVAPGGRIVVIDSLQTGDTAELDGLLELFPQLFHEPYYRSYLTEDVSALFAAAGLELMASWPAFLSKVQLFQKVQR
ncbi:class I SAM-dependent methyltransferase [Acuticoccus sp. I52.16.1]|uniref:class I SAM-dependent methyltransferase n=1 Tax=Acuticoccus sp. I52.16.1 TaxID=2928472 RepID=UPI001FD234D2|nr:class I SAM-dependent methyltransferase [Acuticoccus sp. I52.16.1]UOM33327.1 class I SAM-dependent methyltransferase [Acuticoccus sp. I52.16.1]